MLAESPTRTLGPGHLWGTHPSGAAIPILFAAAISRNRDVKKEGTGGLYCAVLARIPRPDSGGAPGSYSGFRRKCATQLVQAGRLLAARGRKKLLSLGSC